MLTVDTLQSADDVAKGHRFPVIGHKVGQNTGTKSDLLVEVALSEAVMAELELGRVDILKVGIEDTEGVEFSDVMSANLVGANEELDLERR